MPKLDPFSLSRPAVLEETRTFTDPAQPGQALTLTFRAAHDACVELQIQEQSREWIRDYVTGKPDETAERLPDGSRPLLPPTPLPPVDGRAVVVTKTLCASVAILASLEKPDSGEDKYTFLQWIALAVVMPDAFNDIGDWGADLRIRAAETKKD